MADARDRRPSEAARSARRCFRPQGWAPDSCRRRRRSRKRCCRSSTSRSSSTASRKRVASGVDNIILVTGRGKNAIEDHFDVSVELETFLEARGKTELLAEIRKISNLINFAYVRQGEPLGLGHAVLVTRNLVGDEPFAVILGDDVIDAKPPALRQMIDVFESVDGPVLAIERVPQVGRQRLRHHRRANEIRPGVYRIKDLVEKPPRERSAVGSGDHRPLHPDARHLPGARGDRQDRTGEIQLTNGLRRLLKTRPIYGCRDRRRPPRHRQQARVPEGRRLLRAAAAGPAEPFREYLRRSICSRPTAVARLVGFDRLSVFDSRLRRRRCGRRRAGVRSLSSRRPSRS